MLGTISSSLNGSELATNDNAKFWNLCWGSAWRMHVTILRSVLSHNPAYPQLFNHDWVDVHVLHATSDVLHTIYDSFSICRLQPRSSHPTGQPQRLITWFILPAGKGEVQLHLVQETDNDMVALFCFQISSVMCIFSFAFVLKLEAGATSYHCFVDSEACS